MRFFTTLLFIGALTASNAESAKLGHAEMAHSNLCIKAFTKAERKYGIPKHLLMAVANTESGRYNSAIKRVVPWPWTTNIKGAGAYYDSYGEAVSTVQRAKANGKKSIDVGCMQINLKHHPEAFNSIQDAFDPEKNVNYAAKFLRSNYDEFKSWSKAIGAYHSRTPSRSSKYYALVRKRWSDIRRDVGGSQLEATEYAAIDPAVKVTHLFHPASSLSSGEKSIKLEPFKSYGVPKPQRATTAAHQTFKVAVTDGNGVTTQNFISSKPKKQEMKVIKVAARSTTAPAAKVTVTPLSKRVSFDAPKPKNITVPAVKSSNLNTHQQKVMQVSNKHLASRVLNQSGNTQTRRGPNFIFNQ